MISNKHILINAKKPDGSKVWFFTSNDGSKSKNYQSRQDAVTAEHKNTIQWRKK